MTAFDIQLKKLERDIEHASCYEEYEAACIAHDALSGADEWKAQDKSEYYDYKLIQKRVQRLQIARGKGDVHALMSILHEGLHGNLGNIANPVLQSYCKIGTKKLIEQFINEVSLTLEQIVNANEDDVDFYEKLSFFEETAHAFGRSCLMLSGGAGLGFFHAGVVKSLNEKKLLPTVISGASAGSIIGAMLATRNHDELVESLDSERIYEMFKHWRTFAGLKKGSLFDSSMLENALIELFDLTTFEEAFKKTGRHVTITVSPADLHQHSRLLNAKTSPNAISAKQFALLVPCLLCLAQYSLRRKPPLVTLCPIYPTAGLRMAR